MARKKRELVKVDGVTVPPEEEAKAIEHVNSLAPVAVEVVSHPAMEIIQNGVKDPTDTINEVTDRIMNQAGRVVEAAMSFSEIDPETDAGHPPNEWVEQFGSEEAWRRYRVARAAWMPAKDAPFGITVAKNMFVGIMKARATAEAAPRQLNVAVQMVSPGSYNRAEIEVD